ncbi:GTP-binding protein [Algimonas ampicilliniresistens]|uniref:GTP-binding protein n=1 Tax=Algimonas ampicilliniresistens TaxID=1298735 RepID=A0ABQ5VBF3_9PROT|nr:hypothetical protein [Algimonas ampicilliniresistens]GLQ23916.1 GTP-binding protein [Algimonas ampicilliniresistens]
MRIDGFRFRHVGPFGADGVAVDGLVSGLNVVAEHNERGKSSLLRALQLFLLQGHTTWGKRGNAIKRDDGSATGEIDFTHQGVAYRLIKTYQRGKDAQLIDRSTGATLAKKGEADERMAAIMGTADKARGPSGLLWVEQGLSMDAVQDDGLVASKLETELSTLVGGDRARDYLARTEAALGELLTATGRPRVGGPLKLAEDALEQVESQLADAHRLREQTRQIGLDLMRVRAALSRLQGEDDDTETDARIAQVRTELDSAKAARASLETAQALAQRLTAETEQAERRLADHLATIARYDRAKQGVTTERKAVTNLMQRRDAIKTSLADIDAQLSALRHSQSQLAAAQSARANVERVQDRQAALQQVESRLEALDTLLADREKQVEARNALPEIDRATLDQLAALEQDAARLEHRLGDVDVQLRLTLEAGATASLDGRTIGSGTVRLDATSELILPGVGRIALDAPEADTLKRDRDGLIVQAEDLRARLGVTDYADAATALRARADIDATLRMTDKERDRIAPDGRDTLIDRKAALLREIETLTDLIAAAPELEVHVDAQTIDAEIATRSGARAALQDEQVELSGKLEAAKTRLDAHQLALTELPESAAPKQRTDTQAELAAAAATTRQRAETALSELETLRAQAPTDPDLLQASLNRLTQVRENRAKQLTDLKQKDVELSARRSGVLDRSDPDLEVKALDGQAETLRETVEQHRRHAQALTLLRDTLGASQRQLQDQYTEPVRRELAPLLARVIDGADLSLNETLGAQGLLREGRDDDLALLSGGTREQIAILTRLAFARLLARGGQACPVILDDALVYADDDRRARMFDVLNYVSVGEDALQLLYLSCHERAARELGGHRLTLTSWLKD